MQILLYGINFAPELTGIGKYTGESARHYAETHFHVDAVLGRFVARLEQELLLK